MVGRSPIPFPNPSLPKQRNLKSSQRRVTSHQRRPFHLRLRRQHPVKLIAVRLRVAAGADAVGMVHGQVLEALGQHVGLELRQQGASLREFANPKPLRLASLGKTRILHP